MRMNRTDVSFEASDGKKIQTYQWKNNDNPHAKAIIQIAHGMAEHVLRYEDFANFLTENGFIVYGNDHRGHGNNIVAPDDKGFFTDHNGFHRVVADMYELTNYIKKTHPNVPVIIFGHSMGSFLTRRFIQLHGNEVDGVILSGTGGDQGIMGKLGLLLAKAEKRRIGRRTPSKVMDKLVFGKFNEQFDTARTDFDFLSRDTAEVDAYIADDLCGFICSSGFFADLLEGINLIHQKKEVMQTPKALPILLISGDADPVGDNGKGVKNVYELYRDVGCEHVAFKLYNGARHELINETNKEEVYEDVLNWMIHILE